MRYLGLVLVLAGAVWFGTLLRRRPADEGRRSLYASLVVLLGIMLGGCSRGYDGPRQGEVIEHRYDDPDDYYVAGYTIPGSCYTQSNGTRSCSPDIVMPSHWEHEPERHLLVISDGEKEGTLQVDANTYRHVRDGQWLDTETMEVVLR